MIAERRGGGAEDHRCAPQRAAQPGGVGQQQRRQRQRADRISDHGPGAAGKDRDEVAGDQREEKQRAFPENVQRKEQRQPGAEHGVKDVGVADGAEVCARIIDARVIVAVPGGEQAEGIKTEQLQRGDRAAYGDACGEGGGLQLFRSGEQGDAEEDQNVQREHQQPVTAPRADQRVSAPGGAEPGERRGSQKGQCRELRRAQPPGTALIPDREEDQRREPCACGDEQEHVFGKSDVPVAGNAGKQ